MLKRKKQIIAKVMATTMLASTLATAFTPEADAAELQTKASISEANIAGGNRYKTAVEISKNYSSTSKHAVIVNGQKGIVDALSATPYASLKKAPILMTESDKLNADTKAELSRRNIKTVDIVGGTGSVNDSVKAEIEAMGITVNRIWGKDKYATSLAVAKEIDKISDISKIAVTSGEGLADAVSVAAPAAQNKMPIILAHPTNGLDAETKKYIDGENISNSYVIGGTSSVSTATQNSLPGTKERLSGGAGTGRAETNAAVVKKFYPSSSYDNVYVAKSGQVNKADEIADALALGVLAASKQDPVILVGNSLGSTQKTLLEGKEVDKITTVGKGIPTASINAIKETQNSTKTVTTVADLKTALANARDDQTINFSPSGTVSEDITLSTTKDITVNLNGIHSGNINVDMENGTLNINGNVSKNISRSVSNKVSVDAVKSINIKSGVTVKHLEIKSGAKNSNISNKGTVTTFDVLATGVKITGSGNITTFNPNYDTNFNEFTGTIGNIDTTKTVSQVTVQNAKELVIRFSKPVDKGTVITDGKLHGTNIVITEIGTDIEAENTITEADAKATLDENRTTLTITPKDGQYFKGNYGLEIKNVKSNATTLETYKTTFLANDITAPQISSVEFNQNTNNFEISLSEPVVNIDDMVLRINDKSISTATLDSTKKKITIPRTDAIVELGKTANIYIARIKDAAGNVMETYTKSVSVSKNNLGVESVTQLANNKIRVKFTKALSSASNSKITGTSDRGIVVNKSNDTNTPKTDYIKSDSAIVKAPSSVDSTGRTYDIELNDVLGANTSQSLNVVISKSAYTDNTGISIDSTNDIVKYITINKDSTKPTVSTTSLNSIGDAIEVTFSEAIKEPTISNIGIDTKIKLMKNTLPVIISSYEIKNDKTLVIKCDSQTSNGKLNPGNYQVHFKDESIQDLSGNKIVAVNTSIVEVAQTTLPSQPLEVSVYQKEDDDKPEGITLSDNEFLVVAPDGREFDTNMFGASAKPNEHFKIDINNTLSVLPSNTEITFVDDGYNEIKVSLPEDYVKETGKYTLEVSGLTLAKKGIETTQTKKNERTINLTDNSAPTLKSVKLETVKDKDGKELAYELRLMFDEEIKLTAASTNLSYGTEHTGNINLILPNLEIKTGTKVYDKTSAYACKYQVKSSNKKEVIISIDPALVKNNQSWKDTLGSTYYTTLSITNELDLVRDTDSINENDGKMLKARKVNAINISRTSRTE